MIHIDLKAVGKPLYPYWQTCVGAGRANEGLRADWQEHLAMVQAACAFSYIRFHGLFHDDMFVLRLDAAGSPVYNFQYVDALFDRLLALNIRPFVELGFFPDALKGGDATQFWWKGHIQPGNDCAGWAALVEAITRHWVARYGIDEVRLWYFEVWNEPNLPAFWAGTKQQYFDLYEATVIAVKKVDPLLRVGGPATSNFVPDDRFAGETLRHDLESTHLLEDLNAVPWHGVWIEDFLSFCHRRALPVDFVSCHPYPTDFALDETGGFAGRSRYVHATRDDLRWISQAVRSSPYPDAEIHLTEWSSSPSPRDCTHDFPQEAAFIVKANIEGSGYANSLSYWTFTDVFEEGGAGDSIFHGGFGMINLQGIKKPAFHAYRMLCALGDEEISRNDHYIATRRNGRLVLLCFHYPQAVADTVAMSPFPDRRVAWEQLEAGTPLAVEFAVAGLQPNATLRLERLDRRHGWALALWAEMGYPEPPTREEAQRLRNAADSLYTGAYQADSKGCLTLRLTLPPWSVVLLVEDGCL